MAPIGKGTINFGLVNIPVGLAAAVCADNISFRMLDAETGSPVTYERVRASDGTPVPWTEIVKGFDYVRGQCIVLTDDDVKKDVVGIGKIIVRQHQHLAGIHVVGNALVLEVMRFAAAVVDVSTYAFPPATGARPQERYMAIQLVKSMQAHFDAEKYTDDYRAILMRIIRARSNGKQVTFDEPLLDEADGKVLDLMSMGKSVASVFSLRAQPAASVSTPLTWQELTSYLDPRAAPCGRRCACPVALDQ